MVLLPVFVNHRAPSGPDAMPDGWEMSPVNLVLAPAVVVRPIELSKFENQSAPSGPAVISCGLAIALASLKLDTDPDVVIRPTEFVPDIVNHNAPSLPAVIAVGAE